MKPTQLLHHPGQVDAGPCRPFDGSFHIKAVASVGNIVFDISARAVNVEFFSKALLEWC